MKHGLREEGERAGHVALLGDSVFDNAAYVGRGPDVISQVRQALPPGWRATLLAVDGSTTGGVARQLDRLPPDVTHLVVSAGGNDALGHAHVLGQRADSAAEVLGALADIKDSFEDSYSTMLSAVQARRIPAALCTIYYPNYPDALMQRLAVTALTIFNDCITRAAFSAGVPLLDLRLICDDPADYANPIEPSSRGGEKIAGRIARAVTEHDFRLRRTTVFV